MLETVEVANVRCSGCAATITKSLEEEGFTDISVDLSCEPRKVTVDVADEARSAQFKAILRKLGYPLYHEPSGMIDTAGLKAKSFVSCAIGKFVVNNDTK